MAIALPPLSLRGMSKASDVAIHTFLPFTFQRAKPGLPRAFGPRNDSAGMEPLLSCLASQQRRLRQGCMAGCRFCQLLGRVTDAQRVRETPAAFKELINF